MTYLWLNLLFMTIAVIALKVRKVALTQWVTLALLLMLTAVFDSVIVALHIVAYDESKILGLYIGRAPLEDFCYSLLAVLIMPRLWHVYGKRS